MRLAQIAGVRRRKTYGALSSLNGFHPVADQETCGSGRDGKHGIGESASERQPVGCEIPKRCARGSVDLQKKRPVSSGAGKKPVIGEIAQEKFGEDPLSGDENKKEAAAGQGRLQPGRGGIKTRAEESKNSVDGKSRDNQQQREWRRHEVIQSIINGSDLWFGRE